jgi:hypothetical protein
MIGAYRSFQRLEPRSYNNDPSMGIKASVYDPLWMLTRQWQLGEFEGEDSGSPVTVDLKNEQGEISHVLKNDGSISNYDASMPLEVFVERTRLEVATSNAQGDTEFRLDLNMQLKLGLQFQKELNVLLKELLDSDELRRFKRFLAKDPELRFELNDKQASFEPDSANKFLAIVTGRVINIYQATSSLDDTTLLDAKTKEYFDTNPTTDPSLPEAVAKVVRLALSNLKNWWYGKRDDANLEASEEPFFERPAENFSVWNSNKLEYDFKVRIAPKGSPVNAQKKLILDASGYKEDHLDWYSFTVSEESSADFELSTEISPSAFATRLKFAGMPEKRWWNFEDGFVDFGSINPKKNNIASLLLMEFALVHSPDWFIIPCRMQIGSINKIDKLRVTDCFGEETEIESAGNTDAELNIKELDESWDSWSMFTLSNKYQNRGQEHNSPYFFLPPALDNVLTGSVVEEVKMLRDETANLVWGVEKTYRTYYGETVSGYDHSVSLNSRDTTPQLNTAPGDDKALKYNLMTSVPRNWIPFIPVQANNQTIGPIDPVQKHIVLQRASMINSTNQRCIRPNSRLLSEVNSPYYVDEAEVPRSGVNVTESFQLVAWYTGESFLWISRRKIYGSGEGTSGLLFDTVKKE